MAKNKEEDGDDRVVEYLLKVVVVGDLGVGKTSLIQRYVHNIFDREYKATIGVDFAYKLLDVDKNRVVRLQLWDIAGQERFGNMTRIYYQEAVGAMIVFDLTRPNTLEAVKKWKTDIDSKVRLHDANESPIPTILLANKCDVVQNGIEPSKLDMYCREMGFCHWFETSAKESINVEECAEYLVHKILETEGSRKKYDDKREDGIEIDVDTSSEVVSKINRGSVSEFDTNKKKKKECC